MGPYRIQRTKKPDPTAVARSQDARPLAIFALGDDAIARHLRHKTLPLVADYVAEGFVKLDAGEIYNVPGLGEDLVVSDTKVGKRRPVVNFEEFAYLVRGRPGLYHAIIREAKNGSLIVGVFRSNDLRSRAAEARYVPTLQLQ